MERSIKISSEATKICEAEQFFSSLLIDFKFSRKAYCRIYLAVNEALINCMKHGNNFSPAKYVTIIFKEESGKYIFRLIDEGNGFDIERIPNPLEKDNLKNECGRGIFLIRHYSDDVYYEENGKIINLIFNK